ncbi:Deoxyhypusine synthase [Clydaea vesicula]|uniref:deoxyhypusine synthase n=1 Tax=Clydaea vesicula TaxID=447962 RepID=A0AAD5XYJ1_9FUNG|nr:Deoxyhypusine synthase [Clydaea vesicula]
MEHKTPATESIGLQIPSEIQDSVLQKSTSMPENSVPIKGINFEKKKEITLSDILESYRTTGLQATNLNKAIEIINKMLVDGVKIYLGYTSNMVTSGLREIFCYLAKNNLISCIVTSAGGIEEDFIKCLADTYLGDFKLDGKTLRKKGLNRAGNLLIPNDNYCKFEDWINPILDDMVAEQKEKGTIFSPSSIINRLGKEINNEDSVYYWCYKNNIPVFCPALTDGSIGDMIYFHGFKNPGFIVDIAQDIKKINDSTVFAQKAEVMRNGADYAVYVSTAQEFDGCDSGASPDEAISWGKIKLDGEAVKVFSDASLVFPLIVSETFVKFLAEKN